MKLTLLRNLLLIAFVPPLASTSAQNAPTPAPAAGASETVKLSVFEVSTQRDYGYRAATVLSAAGTGMDIKDTPVTVNVLTREFIDDLGTSNLKDALQYVPGVNTSARNIDSVVVRGFNPGQRSEFGAGGLALGADFVERVEVMKGPNAIFFGRVAPGGVINRIGKQPKFDAAYTLDLQYGSHAYAKVALDATGPLTKTLAYRIIGYAVDKGDGFEDFSGERGKGLKADLLYRPFPLTNLRLQASAEDQKVRRIHSPARTSSEYLRICAPGGRYDPSIVFNGIPCTQVPHIWTMNQNARLRALGQLNAYFVDRYFHEVHPRGRRAHYDGPDAFKTAARDGLYAGLDHRFNDTFAFKFEWQRSEAENEGLESSWFPRPDGVMLGQRPSWTGNLSSPSWSAEAELVAEFKLGATSHRVLVGADRSAGEGRSWSQTTPPVDFNFSTGAVLKLRDYIPAARSANTTLSWSGTEGFYGVGVSRFFAERLTLLYGARRTEVTQGVNGSATAAGQVIAPYRKTGGRVLTDDTFQGGAVFKVTPAVSLFAGFGETFEPQTAISFDGARLDPVSGEGWEFGAKADFMDGRVATTFSVFRNERTGIANRDFGREITTGTNPWFIAGGSEATEGAELEIFYAPIRNYQAVLGYTNLWTAETIANKENANLVGRGLQYTPKQTVSFWNRYTFTGGRLNHLTVGGGLRYNGKHEALANLDWFKIINPDWVRVDLMLGYETKLFGRKTYLQLNVENLTNKYYYDGEYTAGRPLTAILRARFTF